MIQLEGECFGWQIKRNPFDSAVVKERGLSRQSAGVRVLGGVIIVRLPVGDKGSIGHLDIGVTVSVISLGGLAVVGSKLTLNRESKLVY